ncbi:uncharacterized protein LOC105740360 [Nomascus leucogenys]|uniref:uncharacterized protein LOC105740360 n=1 Tax=Nomascus leucogenys TaxID=61853 RepID=UPI00122D6720|nr:uncharacterized protein LOC105740360 [Nomascus leucogenys]
MFECFPLHIYKRRCTSIYTNTCISLVHTVVHAAVFPLSVSGRWFRINWMGFLISEGTSSPGIRKCDPQFREEEERRPPVPSDGQEGDGEGLGPSQCPGFPAEVSRAAGVCRHGVSMPEEPVHEDRQFQLRVSAAPSPLRPRRRQQQPRRDFPSPPPALSLLLRPGRSPAPDPGGDGADGSAQRRSWSPIRVGDGGGGSEKLSGLQRGQRRELEPRGRRLEGTQPVWHKRPRARGTR